jgi:hypothetical protein
MASVTATFAAAAAAEDPTVVDGAFDEKVGFDEVPDDDDPVVVVVLGVVEELEQPAAKDIDTNAAPASHHRSLIPTLRSLWVPADSDPSSATFR